MQIAPDMGSPGCTFLEGTLPDQAALIGVLNGLYDLGLPLLQVRLVGGDRGYAVSSSEPSGGMGR